MSSTQASTSTNRILPSATFLDLPNELHLKVLSSLPAKDIQRTRRVSKYLRNLVDRPSNTKSLTDEVMARQNEALRSKIAFVTDFTGLDFLEAMRRWLSVRGIWPDAWRRYHHVTTEFWNLWMDHSPAMDAMRRDPALIGGFKNIMYISNMAELLIELYVGFHLDPSARYNVEIVADRHKVVIIPDLGDVCAFLEVLRGIAPPDGGVIAMGSSSGREREFHEKIVNSPDGYLAAPMIDEQNLPTPQWPVTHRSKWEGNWDNDEDYDGHLGVEQNLCDTSRLAEILGVPEQQTVRDAPPLAYCVRTEWAQNRVKKALEGEELKPLVKAAVVEELWLF